MSNQIKGFGNGILDGLKKVLFSDQIESPEKPERLQESQKQSTQPFSQIDFSPSSPSAPEDIRDMKLRVYQLLENMNKPGVDFFEVWNAAVEMGGVNSSHIKSAYTSLRFADKSLDKSRLLGTGKSYIDGLNSVFETELLKRKAEKESYLQKKAQTKSNLEADIQHLNVQISQLQQQLIDKKAELQQIDTREDPQMAAIDQKITHGKQAVDLVLAEMNQVMNIIEKDIN
jgi:hypothetical protein